jgi:hypothetical protein
VWMCLQIVGKLPEPTRLGNRILFRAVISC